MKQHRDNIPDSAQFDVIDAGIYKGHIFGVQARDSNPSQKEGPNKGKTWPMYRFFLRLTHDIEGTALPKPVRLRKDLFAAGQAPGAKVAFIASDDTIANFRISENQVELWKQDRPIGKACFVDINHRTYEKATGTMKTDEETGYPVLDSETGEPIPITEPAIALNVKNFYPDFRSNVLTEDEMTDINFQEQHQIEEVTDEEIPDADDMPF